MYKILVVDDEQDVCELLKFNLEAEGYLVTTVNSAEEALSLMEHHSVFDLILLDVMMENISGFQMAQQLKSDCTTSATPIVFITALDDEDNIVHGLNLGADDYMAKPLSMREVKARVKAVLRRFKGDASTTEPPIQFDQLLINPSAKWVTVKGDPLSLTKLEFEILNLLVAHRGQVFSREELLQRCWPDNTIVLDRTVDVNIARLRKKLGSYGSYIKSRSGYGYTFER